MASTEPKFEPSLGYVTEEVQKEFLRKISVARTPLNKTLIANPDPASTLYIWQVYSIAGEEPIKALVQDFYTAIFASKTEFSAVFEEGGDIKYHAGAQSSYWLDVMGGGERFEGGHPRMRWSHKMGAKPIMNAQGAAQWTTHMRATLLLHKKNLDQVDKRIFPCIVEFLKFKMKGYSVEHSFVFDPTDFEEVENLQEEAKEEEKVVEEAEEAAEDKKDDGELDEPGKGQKGGLGAFLLSCFARKEK